jgi:hypothetical protein
VAELEAINALRVPGSCQCADDDLCAFAKRGEAAEARVAELERDNAKLIDAVAELREFKEASQ